jgi:SAM-dependent methyltransferase
MDGADEDGWSSVATEWAELWGGFADPARHALVGAARIGVGSRVLDVGCGSGEFLRLLTDLGATVAGIDPASAMVDLARALVPDADLRLGHAERLPWPEASFDVVTAVNALQFADDPLDALAEAVRVTVPGGFVGVANWAEGSRNDLEVLERAVADAHDEDLLPDGDLRQEGELEQLLREGGLELVESGLVAVPWEVADDDALVRGVLLGEDAAGIAASASVVLAAAQPFRTPGGGYRLVNAFRYAVGRTPR